jgi:hypothetical protein
MVGDAPEEAPGLSRLYSIRFQICVAGYIVRRIAVVLPPSFGIPRSAQISSGVSRT